MITGHKFNILVDERADIHESAKLGAGTIVEGNVKIGAGVIIGRNCVIEGSPENETIIHSGVAIDDLVKIHPGVKLGQDSRIGTFSVLGHPSKAVLQGADRLASVERIQRFLISNPATEIGPNSIIRSHAVIYSNVKIGARFVTGHSVMIREHTTFGDGCVFGSYASIDGYSSIGSKCHIGQYAQLSQAANIGRGVFIGGHTVFSDNERIVLDIRHDLYGATIEDYVRIGLNSTILPKVVVGKNCLVGAGSLIAKSIPQGSLAYGTPAKFARQLEEKEIKEYIDSVER